MRRDGLSIAMECEYPGQFEADRRHVAWMIEVLGHGPLPELAEERLDELMKMPTPDDFVIPEDSPINQPPDLLTFPEDYEAGDFIVETLGNALEDLSKRDGPE